MGFKENRGLGLAAIGLIYILATLLALWLFRELAGFSLVYRILWADVAATLLVYLASVLLDNATVYDPYWSVAPIVMVIGLAHALNASGPGVWLLVFVICFWGLRLTANWMMTFQDLDHQDWRYDLFKEKFPQAYPLVSLAGIHLFPTLVVFLAMLPAISYLQAPAFRPLTMLAGALCMGATFLQAVADWQMHRFRRTREDERKIIQFGVWKYARHPNYLAEILFWWGIFLFLFSVRPHLWYWGAGALVNTLMFLFISIPMAEKRLSAKKEGFSSYAANTRLLLPLKKNP